MISRDRGTSDPSYLPPKLRSTHFLSLRAYHKVLVWRKSLIMMAILSTGVESGKKKKIKLIMTNISAGSQDILKVFLWRLACINIIVRTFVWSVTVYRAQLLHPLLIVLMVNENRLRYRAMCVKDIYMVTWKAVKLLDEISIFTLLLNIW